jgi:hypothetical protein
MPIERIEGPFDYRSLWIRLGAELKEMGIDVALRAATEKDLDRVSRHQGAFAFIQEVQAKMDQLLAIAHSPNGAVRFSEEDGQPN